MDEVLILVGDAGPQAGALALPVCASPIAAALIVAAIVALAVVALSGLEGSEGPRR
ncbi:hypothetical protein [uncultured Methylobacterium sp.]|uniref:hypothetical protein n=1 Tax=uncultured Methylobacterium sp. TaxID=157278 RepID=UPI0035CB5A64